MPRSQSRRRYELEDVMNISRPELIRVRCYSTGSSAIGLHHGPESTQEDVQDPSGLRHGHRSDRGLCCSCCMGVPGLMWNWADEDTEVRRMQPYEARKPYLCPGCQQAIPAGTGHLVTVPKPAPEERRHWHHGCWMNRQRRRPTGRSGR